MATKDELLSEGEKYFEKVMQDFNQNRKGIDDVPAVKRRAIGNIHLKGQVTGT